MASPDEKRAAELAELARLFFVWLKDHAPPGLGALKGRPPEAFRMNVGIYRKLKTGPFSQVVRFFDDEAEELRLRATKHAATHALLWASPMEGVLAGDTWFHRNEVVFERADRDITRPGALGAIEPALDSLVADEATLTSWRYELFTGITNRTDLVWDDLDEATRAGFRPQWRWILDSEAPRPAYDMNVREIIPVDPNVSLTAFREYLYWYATYSNREKAAERGGDHYNKWRAARPRRKNQREFKPTQLSTRYLDECFYEYVFRKDQTYLLIDLPEAQYVYQLGYTGTPPGRFELGTQLLLKYQKQTSRHPGREPTADELPNTIDAIVFYALDGGARNPSALAKRGQAELGGSKSGRHAYNYKAAVRWFYGDKDVGAGDDETWFNLFVNSLFPDMVYAVSAKNKNAHLSAFTIDELMKVTDLADGPIKDAVAALVATARQDPGTRFLIKGWEYGESEDNRRQLIGVNDKGIVYEWYPKTGLVTWMELDAWYDQNALRRLSADVYQNTRGMIPVIAVITWGGVIVAGGAIAGGGALANATRIAVRDFVQSYGVKKATKELIKKFRTQMVALIVDGLLQLFPRTNNLYFELLRGFVHGFGAGAIEHYITSVDDRFKKEAKRLYKKAVNKLTLGAEKAYEIYQKLNAALTKLQAILHAIQKVWTPQVADAALKALVLVGTDLAIALVISVFVFAYVDYLGREGQVEQAKRDAWGRAQRDAFKLMLKETGEYMAEYAAAVREDLSSDPPSADVVRARNDKLATAITNAVMKAPTEAPGVFAILDEILRELGIDNWRELTELGFLDLISRGFDALLAKNPGLAAQAANVLGQALGELIGTIFLERAMLPKKWRKATITGSRPIDKSIRKVLAGGTAPALWRFAKVPLDEIRLLVKSVVQQVKDLPTDSPGVFERVQRDDSVYRDLLKSIIADERELAASTSRLAADATLPARLEALAARAAIEAPPAIDTVLDAKAAEDPAWPRDAMLFVLENWLRVALNQLLRAFDRLEDDQPFGGTFRLASLLEIAGLSVSLEDKLAAELAVKFAREFIAPVDLQVDE